MPIIELVTRILAPSDRVFDLARSIDLHTQTATGTREIAVGGVTTGLIGLGDEVTWEARHFGIRQRLTVKVTQFDRPHSFTDEMTRGAFQSMVHRHLFEPDGDATLMTDLFTYRSPLGLLGVAADRLFLERYMRGFLIERNRILKDVAETVPTP